MAARHIRLLPILFAIAGSACDDAVQADAAEGATREILENLYAAGLVDEQIEVREDGTVVVEGDAVVTLEASREMAASEEYDFRQYRSTNGLFSSVRLICVDGSRLTGVLSDGLDAALANFNRIDLRFKMRRTSGATAGCDATITMYLRSGEDAEAGFPSGGAPFPSVYVGTGVAGYGVAVSTHVITHELGHCVGLRHSDWFDRSISCGGSAENEGAGPDGVHYIPGTPTGAVRHGSVMNACYEPASTGVWDPMDVFALRQRYMRGDDDIIWQHDNGQVHYWRMAVGGHTGGFDIATPVGPEWHLLGAGDIDGDSRDALVWQHDNGQVHFWRMSMGTPIAVADIVTPVSADWHARGVGDVDGDGTDDLVWQHDNGQVNFWRMRGGVPVAFVDVLTPVGAEWTLRGVGDVDGDGTDDLVWQRDSGLVHYWRMANGAPIAYLDIPIAYPAGNHIEAVGDMTRDGTDDIVWRHDSGQVWYWTMTVGLPTASTNVLTPVGAEWELIAGGNMDG